MQEIQSDVESSRIGINKGGKQKTSFNLESETDSRISSRSSSLGSVRKYRQDVEILRPKLLSPKNASKLGSPRESVDKKFISALN